jgi:hypothetical protein
MAIARTGSSLRDSGAWAAENPEEAELAAANLLENARKKENLYIADITVDVTAQARAVMNAEAIEEYAAAMLDGTVFPAIVVFRDGPTKWLADGFHRLAAAKSAGYIEIEADVREGGLESAIKHGLRANAAHGLRRTQADRRKAIETAIRIWPDWSDREVARRCSVSPETVHKMRASLPITGSEDGSDTRTYITKHGSLAVMNTAKIGRRIAPAVEAEHLLDQDDRTEPAADAQARCDDAGELPAEGPDAAVIPVQPQIESACDQGVHDEWFTQAVHVAAVREVLGTIDLDPASCERANETVGAARYFTKDQDGLAQPWVAGTLFLNPPYPRLASQFVSRLRTCHASGDVGEAILLVHADTGSSWFEPLLDFPVCLVKGCIRYVDGTKSPDDKPDSARADSAFVYFGPNPEAFVRVFSRFGTVVTKLRLVTAGPSLETGEPA